MFAVHALGWPRIGLRRELKFALERCWQYPSPATYTQLVTTQELICEHNWFMQKTLGLEYVTVGDFAMYDRVLSTLVAFNGLPTRFNFNQETWLEQQFIAARGRLGQKAMEMKKWFNTNYHYLVPEYSPDMQFVYKGHQLRNEIAIASKLGCKLKVAVIGPITLLWLGKEHQGLINRLELLPQLIEAYKALMIDMKRCGVQIVQMEEPALCLESRETWLDATNIAYQYLSRYFKNIVLATYYAFPQAPERIFKLPVLGFHVDVTVDLKLSLLALIPEHSVVSVGIVDGRTIWANNIAAVVYKTAKICQCLKSNEIWLSTSCPLIHVPQDVGQESHVDPAVKRTMAFGLQKMDEVVKISCALANGRLVKQHKPIRKAFSPMTCFNSEDLINFEPTRLGYQERRKLQEAALVLPTLPTTTIGSFPQTPDLRKLRLAFRNGLSSKEEYVSQIAQAIAFVVAKQHQYGLDVLVHGEIERNDMVEFFGESLDGFVVTKAGWVQSYGSRCTKPPIVYSDIYLTAPMTTYWYSYAQSLTTQIVKGMTTGPTTILNWSFVRDDVPKQDVGLQLALCLQHELKLLESRGAQIIQMDEPAIREGLPLNYQQRTDYLMWAVTLFNLIVSHLSNTTQVHSHMCYSELHDILETIVQLDVDVMSIEAARSSMVVLECIMPLKYKRDLGLGVYDIHSPLVPTQTEIEQRITYLIHALSFKPISQIWINPDCGLKTRTWQETDAALVNMVNATKSIRLQLDQHN